MAVEPVETKRGLASREISVQTEMVVWPGYCACCRAPNPTRKTTLYAPKHGDVSQNVPICEQCAGHVPEAFSSILGGVPGLLAMILGGYALFRFGDEWAGSLKRMFGLFETVWLGLILLLGAGLVLGTFVLSGWICLWADKRKRLQHLRPECAPGDDPVTYVGYRAASGDHPPVHVFRFLVSDQGAGYADLFAEANAAASGGSEWQTTSLLARALASDDIQLREKAVESAIQFAFEGSAVGVQAIEAAIRILHQGPVIAFHSPGILTGQAEDLLQRGAPAAGVSLREMAANDQLWETSPDEVQRLLSLATTLKDPVEFLEEIHAEFGDRQTKAIQLYWAAMSARAVLARRS